MRPRRLCLMALVSACAEVGVGLPRLAGPSAVPSPAPSPVNQFSSVIIPMSLGRASEVTEHPKQKTKIRN